MVQLPIRIIVLQESLLNVDASEVDYLLGIFNGGHLNYNLEANETEPDLTDMALVAMNILKQNENGYLLLVEGMFLYLVCLEKSMSQFLNVV